MSTPTKDEIHTAEDHWEIDRWRPNNWWCSGGLMQRNKPPTPVCCTPLIFQRPSAVVIKSCNIIHCHGEENENYGFSFIFFFIFIFHVASAIAAFLTIHFFYSSIYADVHRCNHRRGFPRRLTTQPIKLI